MVCWVRRHSTRLEVEEVEFSEEVQLLQVLGDLEVLEDPGSCETLPSVCHRWWTLMHLCVGDTSAQLIWYERKTRYYSLDTQLGASFPYLKAISDRYNYHVASVH